MSERPAELARTVKAQTCCQHLPCNAWTATARSRMSWKPIRDLWPWLLHNTPVLVVSILRVQPSLPVFVWRVADCLQAQTMSRSHVPATIHWAGALVRSALQQALHVAQLGLAQANCYGCSRHMPDLLVKKPSACNLHAESSPYLYSKACKTDKPRLTSKRKPQGSGTSVHCVIVLTGSRGAPISSARLLQCVKLCSPRNRPAVCLRDAASQDHTTLICRAGQQAHLTRSRSRPGQCMLWPRSSGLQACPVCTL